MSFYPIYLTRISDRKVILIGGNHEAERKAAELLEYKANLTVISPHLSDNMLQWHKKGRFDWISRTYNHGDLEQACLVIAAEYDADQGNMISAEAHDRNIPVNIMDNIQLSDFAFGTIVKKGELTISMSSGGLAPALIVRLKERLDAELNEAYAEFLELASQIRGPIIHCISDFQVKKSKWYEWVDSDTMLLLSQGRRGEALQLTETIWGTAIMEMAGLKISKDEYSK